MITHKTPYIITAISFVSSISHYHLQANIECCKKERGVIVKKRNLKCILMIVGLEEVKKTLLNVIANDHPEKYQRERTRAI